MLFESSGRCNGEHGYQSCRAEGCDKIPNSALQWKKPLFCISHQEEGMIDDVSKQCQHEGCNIIKDQHLVLSGKPIILFESLGK